MFPDRHLASQVERGPTAEAQNARKSSQLTVFISHAVADADVVKAIEAVLKAHDYAPWVADAELLLGDDIGQKISEGIAAADVFLVVLSINSVGSRWVQREIESAVLREVEKRVVVMPVLIGDVEPPVFLQNRFYLRLQPGFAGCRGWPRSALAREFLPDTMLVSLSANPQPIYAVSGNCCVSTGTARATRAPSG
jgi:hypothetical protein